MPRRVAGGLLAGALAVFGLALAAPVGASEHETSTERLAGANRFGTAADVCAQMNEDDDITTVVIATGRNFPDALAAAPLAAALDGCILLTEIDSVPDATLAALREVEPDRIVIVGGTSAVSQDVEDSLEGEAAEVDRVAGDDRYCTAAEVALEIGDGVGTAEESGNTAILATGTLAPDALAAGSISTGGSEDGVFPILLAQGDNLPACTSDALEAFDNVIVVGGTAAVGAGSLDEAEEATGDEEATRVAGNNREETSAAIGRFAVEEFGWVIDEIILATGRPPAEIGTFSPDALVAGPLAGERQAPIILVAGVDDLGPAAEDFIEEFGGGFVLIICVGGTAVISNDTCDAASTLAEEQDPIGPDGADAPVTTRPELVSAAIGATVTSTQVTPTSPAGTRVNFTFDEALSTLPGFTPQAALFHVYSGSGTQYSGSGTPTLSADAKTVTVNFAALDTAALAGALTVATVDFSAVRDTGGAENPEGDAPVGTTVTTTPAASAGRTTAPDLLTVSGFRQASTANTTAVDFTFDQAAFVATPTGFHLITTDGQDMPCTASSTAGIPSGGTVAGGQGTTTLTVTCANYTPTGTSTVTAFTASNVARGTVDAGAVGTAAAGAGVTNPLQAADVAGSSNEPDIVSVTFSAGDATSDTAVFTFDQSIIHATPTNFRAYSTSGAEFSPSATGSCLTATASTSTTTCVINASNPQQVLVYFANNSLASAVGGNVRDNAAEGTLGTTTVVNEQDEEGAAATSGDTATTQEPGATAAPDLIAVAITQGTDPFGNAGAFRAVYTFDEAVLTAGGSPNTIGDFYLYLADGTRLRATACTVGASTTSTPNSSQVTCTAYTATSAATSAQIGASVLGTVDDGAVVDASGTANPEGAEPTTGGTGTPTA